ncbi:hypothetical protein [Paenibacillus sp. BIC5C1]|uniref:hypothetical protein n=1 Tax=Paenibacillus sp. BIC5C1 TaxID=3078263 RepID=UPI0028E6FC44|nr:hypothetical protein [Paenibacillus sp. BIC5C1]
MRLASVLGIMLLASGIIYGEWLSTKQKRARVPVAGITVAAVFLAIVILFLPNVPGPTQVIKLIFGKVDKLMK